VIFFFCSEKLQRTRLSNLTPPKLKKKVTSRVQKVPGRRKAKNFIEFTKNVTKNFTFIKMLTAAGFFSFLLHVCFPPFLVVLGIILCLASIGKSLGIRRLYVKALLRIFEVSVFLDFGPLSFN
jgi:hypothetical protein